MTTPSSRVDDGLRVAAETWAHAWLTGNADDVLNLQPTCRASLAWRGFTAAQVIAKTRFQLQYDVGRPLATVGIRGVRARHATSTSAEAEVVYDLPGSASGNDNWVAYVRHGAQWEPADCTVPIGRRYKQLAP